VRERFGNFMQSARVVAARALPCPTGCAVCSNPAPTSPVYRSSARVVPDNKRTGPSALPLKSFPNPSGASSNRKWAFSGITDGWLLLKK
jgi:hypothetical protein